MARPMKGKRQRELRDEVRRALPIVVLPVDGRPPYADLQALAVICREPDAWAEERYEAAARALAETRETEPRDRDRAVSAWIERYILDPGSPDRLVKDDAAHRRLREYWLGRLRDRERRGLSHDSSGVTKVAVSRAHVDRLRYLCGGNETQRATLERLIDSAYRKAVERERDGTSG